MKDPLPLWRSLLYVPANRSRFVEKARSTGADAIQLDLEDSIAPGEKDAARLLVRDAAATLADVADVIVRINRPLSLAVRDIEAVVCPQVTAISLPKVEGPEQVRLLAEVVAEAEVRTGMTLGATRLIVGIESAAGWLRMHEIATAHERIVAMLLGSEDFSQSVGMAASPEALHGPKQAMVIAAAAAGILPLGLVGSFANYRDVDAFAAMIERSVDLGFKGASCIHPDQVAALNDGFSPRPAAIADARKVVAAFDQAVAAGQGAVGLEGRMLDLPVVERARATLARAARLPVAATG